MILNANSNSTSLNVLTSYSSNIQNLRNSMTRLSSGVKNVTDDPAGISISERMRAQARSTEMARQNVQSGISLLQTADAWLQKINDIVGRMHELAVQVNDGTKTTVDKDNLQSEFGELQDEIVRITSYNTAAAKFNGLYLFRGGTGDPTVLGDSVASGNISLQIGANVNQAFTLSLDDLQVTNNSSIGTVHSYTYSTNGSVVGSTHTVTSFGSVINSNIMSARSADTVGKIQLAIDHVTSSRARLGAQQSRLQQITSGLLSHEENLRSAESKIRDVDVARESASFARYQILSQISNSMLAQANQLPAQAIQLLQ